MITRRGFLQGILTACAAPAIVKVANLMPVTSTVIHIPTEEEFLATLWPKHYRGGRGASTTFGEISPIARKLWADELAKAMAERIDRTVFDVLTKGVL